MPMTCCVKGCRTGLRSEPRARDLGISFHLPSADLFQKWKAAVPVKSVFNEKTAVCSKHFKVSTDW